MLNDRVGLRMSQPMPDNSPDALTFLAHRFFLVA